MQSLMLHKGISILTINFISMFEEFLSHLRIFHSFAGDELQILTIAQHSWAVSSEGSLTCYTYMYLETGQLFIMVISEDP